MEDQVLITSQFSVAVLVNYRRRSLTVLLLLLLRLLLIRVTLHLNVDVKRVDLVELLNLAPHSFLFLGALLVPRNNFDEIFDLREEHFAVWLAQSIENLTDPLQALDVEGHGVVV